MVDPELFNQKTVERLSSKIKLNAVQKKAAKEWLYYLDEGKLGKEKLNYLKFVKIVLENLLGYETKEVDFEEGNIEFSYRNNEGKTVLGIEAKGTKTKDLFAEQKGYREGQKTPINQLWTYMGQLNLKYGIATNYKDFVLLDFSKGLSAYHFFDFEEIKGNENKLKEFIAIFSKEQIIDNGFIKKLEEASAIEERNFTKEFYKLFHETRLMLIKEFQENGVSKEEAVHYAQLFLNRLMFVFFAEDTDKLQTRLFEDLVISALNTEMIISEHSNLVSTMILNFFLSLDKGSETPRKIFGFNGGLFKEEIPKIFFFKDFKDKKFFDEIYLYSKLKKEPELDVISKPIFQRYQNKLNPIIKNLLILASFDFKTEVSVNILGHIFEQSLSDLEELKEDKSQKRKKEGIFYTPEYITDYICRNTIIPYLSKRNAKITRELILEYANDIKELEEKFANLKILDPACGSGAFLIKAVEVLLEIHKEIQIFKQDEGKYTAVKKGRKKQDGDQLMILKWSEEDEAREIIENNIYGVDLNEESVEITKLSLFLKIAKKNKKLLDLSRNIKVGNSLIEDKEVDQKAFNWKNEFKEVFDDGGFDIVIGNPHYVRQERFSEIKPELEKKFQVYSGVADLYTYFYERGIQVLKQGGYLGYISSNKWMKVKYGLGLRQLLKQKKLLHLIDFFELKVFEDASTEPIIVILENKNTPNKDLLVSAINTLKFKDFNDYLKYNTHKSIQEELEDDGWNLFQDENKNIICTMKKDTIPLIEYTKGKMYRGLVTGANDIYVIDENTKLRLLKESSNSADLIKPFIDGVDIEKYYTGSSNLYLILTTKGVNIDKYPAIKNYLSQNKERLGDIWEVKHKKQKWYEQRGCQYYPEFEKVKIVYIYTAKEHEFALDDLKRYLNNNAYFIVSDDYYLLAFLNSHLFRYYKLNTFVAFGDAKTRGRCKLDFNKMVKVPVKLISDRERQIFNKLVTQMINYKKEFISKKEKFFNRIKSELSITLIPKKLQHFFNLDYVTFFDLIKEASNKKISLKEQDEWEDYFNEYKKELGKLDHGISEINNQIDEEVYKLYGLNQEERKVVEESLK